jgi:cobalt/nickel transport system permease protein
MIFAVHIADGVLPPAIWLATSAAALPLIVWSSWRLRDAEVSRLGVLSAALFVASQIHIPLGPGSVHLLLNGLAGALLGRRAVLAIAVSLTLQALFFAHGGLTTLGVNTLVLALPAVTAGYLFPTVSRRLAKSAGFVLGFATAGVTVGLNVLTIAFGTDAGWPAAYVILAANVPVLIAETLLTGAIVAYLDKALVLPA